jgi:hypothetical protein
MTERHSVYSVYEGQENRVGGRQGHIRTEAFLDAQAGEVPQRDDLRLARIRLFEARQGFVDRAEIGQRGIGALMPLSSSTRCSEALCLIRR